MADYLIYLIALISVILLFFTISETVKGKDFSLEQKFAVECMIEDRLQKDNKRALLKAEAQMLIQKALILYLMEREPNSGAELQKICSILAGMRCADMNYSESPFDPFPFWLEEPYGEAERILHHLVRERGTYELGRRNEGGIPY